jgi:hypothetical protein
VAEDFWFAPPVTFPHINLQLDFSGELCVDEKPSDDIPRMSADERQ